LALSLTLLAPGVGAQTSTPPVGDPAGNEWLTYGGNLFNQRFSSLNQISTSNAANLKGAWTFHTGSMGSFTAFESVPIVAGGVIYLTGPQS
jgi:glucose dehydrogenase